jgi:hypothetical protein
MRTNHHAPALWPGLLLVSLGAGLIARELGFLPAHVRVVDFWPLLIVVLGISVLLRAGGIVSAVLALAFVATGGVLLAGNLGFLTSSVTRLWPILLVLLGLWALFRGGGGPDRPGPGRWRPHGGSPPSESEAPRAVDEDRLSRQYTASGAELRIESQAWKGGELGVTAGGVELDLRHAQLDPDGAVLVLRVLMGGVEIRVPDTWRVQLDVVPFIGGADDSTRSTQGSTSAPRLRITGTVTLGGVSVSN